MNFGSKTFMKTTEISETETNLRLKPRLTESVTIEIPIDTMESLRRVAANRDMSDAALLKLYDQGCVRIYPLSTM